MFISYQYADKELAHSLEVELRARGAETWIDSKNLRLGDSMIERISQAIAEGYFLVALVSPASVKSEWCRTELGYAMSKAISDRRVAVLPLRVNEAEMPPILTGRKWEELGTANVAAVAGLIVADARKHLEEVVGISPSLRADGASIPIAPGPAARRSTPASAEPVPAALQRALLLSLIQPSYYNAIVNGADRALVARVMLAASTPAGALAMLGTSEKNAFEDAVANSRFESLLLDLTSVLKRSGSDHFWRKVDPTTSSLVTVSRPAAKKTHVDGWMVEGRAALSLRPGQAYAQPTWHEVHLDVAIRPSDPARPTGGDEFTPLGLGNLFSLLHAPLSALLDEIAPNVIPLITRTSDYEILAVSGVLLPNGDTFDRYVDLGFFSAARAEGAHGPWGLQWSAATLDQIRTPEARTVMLRAEIERLFSDAGYEDYEQDVRQLAPTRLNPPPKT